ncbi:MAG: Asp23/Gls24 family envelope stress response protein [bacterium]|nr:Asp23/Gls24 family envelope stress response protein [bacterium]
MIVSKELENKENVKIYESNNIGEVQIADDVVAIIAGLAATDVKGVASLIGNVTNEIISKLGKKNLGKGIKVEVVNNVVTVDMSLVLQYGYSIPKTCEQVQEKVKSAIENMTGLTVEEVNVRIASVTMEKSK